MPSFPFQVDAGFLGGSLSRSQRLLSIGLMAIAGLILAYFEYRLHNVLLAPLATLFVVGIQAVGGFYAGLATAGVMALIFAAAEEASLKGRLDSHLVADMLPLLVVYVLVAILLEFIRRQSQALNENRLRLQDFELTQTRGELAAADARYRAVGESIPFGIWHCDADGHVTYMSDSFLQLVGMTLDETAHGGWLRRVVPEDASRIQHAWRDRANWGELWEDEYHIIGADNQMYTILCRGRHIRDERGNVVGWTGINLDITERARAREQLSFLAEAGRVLSLSLDPSTTLERIASLAVPRIADWCAVDVVGEDGEVKSIAVLHADTSKTDIARELRAYPQQGDDSRGLRRVLRTGKPELYDNIPDEMLVQAARDERQLWLLRELGMRSAIIVPL
ncbi:MAG TPA: PAS domain-containing protein, partial [Candidatus Eremiobacteraceae bacterium]|nr:PAS domain-containing protein [Candidatus Eremiobacteraceae bacterium]